MKTKYVIQTCLAYNDKWFGDITKTNKKDALKDFKRFSKNQKAAGNKVKLRIKKVTEEIIEEREI